MSTRLHIVVSEELLARIDGVRGDVPRSTWLRRAVEQRLRFPSVDRMVGRLEGKGVLAPAAEQASSEAKEPLSREQADPGLRTPGEGRSAAPAEQPSAVLAREIQRNNEQVRSSAQVKGDIRPIPKKKP